jgi:nucleotide-binding universal stress UspA family protein
MKTNKVLVPIDGSEYSLQVLSSVRRFLAPEKTEVILLHVAEVPKTVRVAGDNGGIDNDDLVIYADQEAASIDAAFQTSMIPHLRELTKAGFQARAITSFGDPMTEIERVIDKEQIDLVIMATHGRTGLARILLGSVAQHILNHASVPVMLYRSFR